MMSAWERGLERNDATGTPLYERVVLHLTEALFADPPDDGRLPSEVELSSRLSVSRATIRRALEEMEARGLVVRRHGLGTFFVGGNPIPSPPRHAATMDVLHSLPGFRAQCLVIAHERPTEVVASVLGTPAGERVLHVRRLDSVGSTPVGLVDVYMTEGVLPDVSRADVERESLNTLAARNRHPVTGSDQTIYADTLSGECAELLGVASGSACLVIRRTTYSYGPNPVGFAWLRFRGRAVGLQMSLHASESEARGGDPLKLTLDLAQEGPGIDGGRP